jgi:hypothetical protein
MDKNFNSQVSKLDEVPDSLRLFFLALTYDGVDPRKGRDTMMAYCEQHPFALQGDGQWFRGMHWVATFSNDYAFVVRKENPQAIYTYWQPIYNWGIKIQTLNNDSLYQKNVLAWLASCAGNFDRNLACNLWWNFIRLYGEDTLYRNTALSLIAGHRYSQDANGEDTTAFEVLDFPLRPIEVASVNITGRDRGNLELHLNPNPVQSSASIAYSIPQNGLVELTLFDANGRVIRSLVSTYRSSGEHKLDLELGDIASGTYLLRLTANGAVETTQVVIRH